MADNLKCGTVKAKRMGDLQVVKNLLKKPTAADKYSHIRIQTEEGEEFSLLFTDAELRRAKERAEKNPEDCPKVGWLRDILD